MNAALVLLALSATAPSATTLSPGTVLTYEGNFIAEKGAPAVTEKKFRLSLLIADVGDKDADLFWTVQEQGRGGWSWINHFGRFHAAGSGKGATPTLLYERPEGTHVIRLLTPLLFRDKPLAKGTAWKTAKFNHEVTGDAKVGDLDAWRVDVRNAYGLKRRMLIEKDSPLVLSLMENVFIGQGEKHELHYKLAARKQLNEKETAATIAAYDGFIALRNQLGIVPGMRDVKWNKERLGTLRERLPSVVAHVGDGPLAEIAQDAQRDAKNQKNRAGAVALMRGKRIGKAAPQPKLFDLRGKPFDWKSTKGKVTVLHFWEYKDAPLEEPYGQIAYLDFLYRNRESKDIEVYGVANNQRLSDPSTQSRGLVSVKKLRSFMNLSYPILVDYEDALEQFGDPRVTGAKLPLFVVIGPDGKVTHYHVGTYEVNRDRGLEELTKIVAESLDSRK